MFKKGVFQAKITLDCLTSSLSIYDFTPCHVLKKVFRALLGKKVRSVGSRNFLLRKLCLAMANKFIVLGNK